MSLKKWIEALGFGAAAASGVGAEQVAQAAEKEQTPHVEVNRNPEVEFRNAKQAVIDALNESTFDATSGGRLEGKNWTATVEESEGGMVAKITLKSGKPQTEEFDIRKDEVTGPDGNIKDVFSMNTGVPKSIEKEMAEKEQMLAAVRGDVARAAGKDKTVAMNGPESGK